MALLGKDETMSDPMPALDFVPKPCPQCGARTARTAEKKCKATQNISGDYECAGSDCIEDKEVDSCFRAQRAYASSMLGTIDRSARTFDSVHSCTVSGLRQ